MFTEQVHALQEILGLKPEEQLPRLVQVLEGILGNCNQPLVHRAPISVELVEQARTEPLDEERPYAAGSFINYASVFDFTNINVRNGLAAFFRGCIICIPNVPTEAGIDNDITHNNIVFASTDGAIYVNKVFAADYVDLSGNSIDQNLFETFSIAADSGFTWGSSNVVADGTTDTFQFVAGYGIALESDATNDGFRISLDQTEGSHDYWGDISGTASASEAGQVTGVNFDDNNTVQRASGSIYTNGWHFDDGNSEYVDYAGTTSNVVDRTKSLSFRGSFNLDDVVADQTIFAVGGTGNAPDLRVFFNQTGGGILTWEILDSGASDGGASTVVTLSASKWYFFWVWADLVTGETGIWLADTSNTLDYVANTGSAVFALQNTGSSVFEIGRNTDSGDRQYVDGIVELILPQTGVPSLALIADWYNSGSPKAL